MLHIGTGFDQTDQSCVTININNMASTRDCTYKSYLQLCGEDMVVQLKLINNDAYSINKTILSLYFCDAVCTYLKINLVVLTKLLVIIFFLCDILDL